MKTIADIKENVELLALTHRHARMETKSKIFEYYKDVAEINKLISDLENVQNGQYEIDNFGELIYSIDVPKHIKELPEIGDYLNQDFGHYYDGKISIGMGGFISINYSRDDRSYFVFDHDSRKPIINERVKREHPTISEDDYLRAKIELYQRKLGEFKDVVIVDYYGGYDKHFEFMSDSELTDKELQEIVDQYEIDE